MSRGLPAGHASGGGVGGETGGEIGGEVGPSTPMVCGYWENPSNVSFQNLASVFRAH